MRILDIELMEAIQDIPDNVLKQLPNAINTAEEMRRKRKRARTEMFFGDLRTFDHYSNVYVE